MTDPMVYQLGHVRDMDDCAVFVGVDHGTVTVHSFGTAKFSGDQAEEFAQLFTGGVWRAAQQKTRMDAENGIPFGPDCRCWCHVRPIACALSCCGCIIHDHTPGTETEVRNA